MRLTTGPMPLDEIDLGTHDHRWHAWWDRFGPPVAWVVHDALLDLLALGRWTWR